MKKVEEEFQERLRDMGCIICRHRLGIIDPPRCSIHHQRTGYGIAQKAKEYEVMPLCHIHHQFSQHGEIAFHAGQKSWEQRYGKTEIEWIELAQEEGGWVFDNNKDGR